MHRHDPVETPIVVEAGFRKKNLPTGFWPVLTSGVLFACECGQRFIETSVCGRRGLIELEDQASS